VRTKIIADRSNGRVIGAQFVSRVPVTDKVDVVSLAIHRGLTVRELAGLSYSAQPWQSYFPAGNAIVDACDAVLTKMP
jgi:pyruvate/2-oxoglutarate dehydrogenase complex dihydrolipoamide dehydrogenase (E3) component